MPAMAMATAAPVDCGQINGPEPAEGLRLRPYGPALRTSRSAEPSSRAFVPSSGRGAQAEGRTTKPAGPPVAVLRAVMSEDVVFVNKPG